MKRRALIIDDDPDCRELVCGLLSVHGYQCLKSDGLQDIACDPSRLDVDLILIDYELGDFTGDDVLSYLRDRCVEANIILMSACHDDEMQTMIDQGRRSGLGMLGRLGKPFDLKHLIEMLSNTEHHHNPLRLNELDKALEKEQLNLVYQPKIDLKSGKVIGAEALVRWHHPLRGMVMPNQFIALAERSNRIQELTWQVINQGFCQQRHWQAEGLSLNLAINLSPKLFLIPDVLKKLDKLAVHHAINPRCITLELTESSGIDCLTYARHLLNALRERGYRLALDDFGTGFSSMVQLYNLPFDELKIDQCFVGRSDVNPEARAITRTIVELGRRLNLEVVGEGIETTGQCNLLCDTHCHIGQGYLFSRPLEIVSFDTWCHHLPSSVQKIIARNQKSTLKNDTTP